MWTRQRIVEMSGLSYAQIRRLDETGLVKARTIQAGFKGGGKGGALHTFKPREVLNVLVIASLRRAGVPLQRVRKAITYLRDNLDLKRPLEEAIFLVGTGRSLYVIAYTAQEFRDIVLDVAQRQGQVAMAPIVLGELWTRVMRYDEATREEPEQIVNAVA